MILTSVCVPRPNLPSASYPRTAVGTIPSEKATRKSLPSSKREVSLLLFLNPSNDRSWKRRFSSACADMDFLGLFLLATCLGLILLPLGLAPNVKGGWSNPSMVRSHLHVQADVQPAMVIVGLFLFPFFLYYEYRYPRSPFLPMRWFYRGPILGACLIGFFDFASFYLQGTYLYS